MALKYEIDDKLKTLVPVLDEHAEWFGRVMRRVFYPEEYLDVASLPLPSRFKAWEKEESDDDFIKEELMDSLRRAHDELHRVAVSLMEEVLASGNKPDFNVFNGFIDLYDDFIFRLRRLERDFVQIDSGLDIETGLRSRKVIYTDMEREMERRSRRGMPFCLVLACIDDYKSFRALVDETQYQEIMATFGRVIQKCLRSFDDAYRLNDSEFIMSLKHADTTGGSAAINRLRLFLEEENLQIEDNNGKAFSLTMSYCAAEPVPGDSVQDLFNNMRDDLSRFDDGADTALEHLEQSPLEHYVRGKEG